MNSRSKLSNGVMIAGAAVVGVVALGGALMLGFKYLEKRNRYRVRFQRGGNENSKLIMKQDLIKILKDLRSLYKADLRSITADYKARRRAIQDDPIEYEKIVNRMYEKLEKRFGAHINHIVEIYQISLTLLERSTEAHMCPEIREIVEDMTTLDSDAGPKIDPALLKSFLEEHKKLIGRFLELTNVNVMDVHVLSALMEDQVFFEYQIEFHDFIKELQRQEHLPEYKHQLEEIKESLHRLQKKNKNLFNTA